MGNFWPFWPLGWPKTVNILRLTEIIFLPFFPCRITIMCTFSAINGHIVTQTGNFWPFWPHFVPYGGLKGENFWDCRSSMYLPFFSWRIPIMCKFSATNGHYYANDQFLTLLTPIWPLGSKINVPRGLVFVFVRFIKLQDFMDHNKANGVWDHLLVGSTLKWGFASRLILKFLSFELHW